MNKLSVDQQDYLAYRKKTVNKLKTPMSYVEWLDRTIID